MAITPNQSFSAVNDTWQLINIIYRFLFSCSKEINKFKTVNPPTVNNVTLEFREKQSTPSPPALPGPLWPGVVAPGKVLSMGQIELFDI